MYFNYKEKWTGGHDVVGARAPATTFYFAEGTGPDASSRTSPSRTPAAEATLR